MVYLSARGALTKYHKRGGLNNRNIFSQSGGWKPKIKVPAGLVSGENSLLGLYTAAFSLCPPMVSHGCG